MTNIFATISVLFTRLYSLFAGFLASIILASGLGVEDFGTYSAIIALLAIVISLGDLGIRQAVTYLYPRETNNHATLFGALLILFVVSSLATVSIIAVFMLGTQNRELDVVLPALVAIPSILLTSYVRGISLGIGSVSQYNRPFLIEKTLHITGLLIASLTVTLNVAFALWLYAASTVAAATYSLQIVRRLKLRFSFRSIARPIRKVLSLGIVYAGTLFVLNLNYKVDIILVEQLLGSISAGPYSVGVRLAELLWQVPTATGVVLMSLSARSRLDEDAIDRTARILRWSLPLLTVLATLLYFLAPTLVHLFFGSDYAPAVLITRILLPGIVIGSIFKILNADLAGRGRPAVAFGVYSWVTAGNIALTLILIPTIGEAGAAIATTIAYTVGAIFYLRAYAKLSQIPTINLVLLTRDDARQLFRRVKALR